MSKIEKVVRFRVRGTEFNSIEGAINDLENQVLLFVTRMDHAFSKPMMPAHRADITQYLLDHRDEIRALLDFSSDPNQFDEEA